MACSEREHPHGVQPEHLADLIGDTNLTRNKGLGSLHILDDERILNILGLLSAEHLAVLGCVSKALYCFSSHEELWKSFVLEVR